MAMGSLLLPWSVCVGICAAQTVEQSNPSAPESILSSVAGEVSFESEQVPNDHHPDGGKPAGQDDASESELWHSLTRVPSLIEVVFATLSIVVLDRWLFRSNRRLASTQALRPQNIMDADLHKDSETQSHDIATDILPRSCHADNGAEDIATEVLPKSLRVDNIAQDTAYPDDQCVTPPACVKSGKWTSSTSLGSTLADEESEALILSAEIDSAMDEVFAFDPTREAGSAPLPRNIRPLFDAIVNQGPEAEGPDSVWVAEASPESTEMLTESTLEEAVHFAEEAQRELENVLAMFAHLETLEQAGPESSSSDQHREGDILESTVPGDLVGDVMVDDEDEHMAPHPDDSEISLDGFDEETVIEELGSDETADHEDVPPSAAPMSLKAACPEESIGVADPCGRQPLSPNALSQDACDKQDGDKTKAAEESVQLEVPRSARRSVRDLAQVLRSRAAACKEFHSAPIATVAHAVAETKKDFGFLSSVDRSEANQGFTKVATPLRTRNDIKIGCKSDSELQEILARRRLACEGLLR